MAMLSCRHCDAPINSDARLTQCKKCGSLFPFECHVCQRQLRPPFPVFDDERYLTLDNEPLCGDHFLRKCPDCSEWFRADENPGFFRCRKCADAAAAKPRRPVPIVEEVEEMDEMPVPAPVAVGMGMGSNTVVLAGAGFAFLALIGYIIMHGLK